MTDPTIPPTRPSGRIPPGFAHEPAPRSPGSAAAGLRMAAGIWMLGGQRIDRSPAGPRLWDLPLSPSARAEAQAMVWLDDLAAVGGIGARQAAQAAVFAWIDRDQGDGWPIGDIARDPAVTGQRLLRWLHHAGFLTQHRRKDDQRRFAAALDRQLRDLAIRADRAAPGLPRAQALAALICGAVLIQGAGDLLAEASAGFQANIPDLIDATGGIASRSPGDLLAAFELLVWTADALSMAGHVAGPAHLDALSRTAPVLRGLRLADGRLARFHGGVRGARGRLDHALADSGLRGPASAQPMGFVRLAAGRSVLVMDAAAPPDTAPEGQASTLGFEMSSGGRMLIVTGGEGARFGPAWGRAVRATAMHSAPGIAGLASSRAAAAGGALIERPARVWLDQPDPTSGDHAAVAGHDGYGASHGLAVVRSLTLSDDGTRLDGADGFAPLPGQTPEDGAVAELRFHLPPGVQAAADVDGLGATIRLPATEDGALPDEFWRLTHDGSARLTLEPGAALEGGADAPEPGLQIVLRAPVAGGDCRIGWTLARSGVTPRA
ncbi:heparinase II/III family protein [Paracoccus sp. p4-l81]|uniref:heparinase II/III family protein n=1 Tax=Paracoccus sp. p4-l81 TaxID=3342806 RepID=UPI0035B711ED